MENEQISLFGNEEKPKKRNLKRNWENAFQRWSDKEHDNEVTPNGKCGYGYICDYCSDQSKGRPCVHALNTMLREKKKAVDYNIRNFEDIWNGEL